MLRKFDPKYTVTATIAKNLGRIENTKDTVITLPLTPTVLSSLQQTAKVLTTHYSTMIEGNQLQPSEIKQVIEHEGHFPGRKRDENEIRGYYVALEKLEEYVAQNVKP